MNEEVYGPERAERLVELLRALADRIRRLDAEGRLLEATPELLKQLGTIRSELFHYEVRLTYDTPEVAESRRIVEESRRPDNTMFDEPDDEDEPWRSGGGGGRGGMKRFYIMLGVIAVAGVVGIWYASAGSTSTPAALAPGAAPPVPATDGFRGFTLGSDSAPVEVVEYSDFECPYCAQFAAVQMPTIRKQLIETGKVRWRYRDFPLPSHAYSRLAAHAAHCAAEQGRFWEMHDQLFFTHSWAQTGRDPSKLFREFAGRVGLDAARYDECMATGRHAGRIEASRLEAEALRLSGTPSFYVNGRPYNGPRSSDAFKATVDSLVAAAR